MVVEITDRDRSLDQLSTLVKSTKRHLARFITLLTPRESFRGCVVGPRGCWFGCLWT